MTQEKAAAQDGTSMIMHARLVWRYLERSMTSAIQLEVDGRQPGLATCRGQQIAASDSAVQCDLDLYISKGTLGLHRPSQLSWTVQKLLSSALHICCMYALTDNWQRRFRAQNDSNPHKSLEMHGDRDTVNALFLTLTLGSVLKRSQPYASLKSSKTWMPPWGSRVCSTMEGAEYISALTHTQWPM